MKRSKNTERSFQLFFPRAKLKPPRADWEGRWCLGSPPFSGTGEQLSTTDNHALFFYLVGLIFAALIDAFACPNCLFLIFVFVRGCLAHIYFITTTPSSLLRFLSPSSPSRHRIRGGALGGPPSPPPLFLFFSHSFFLSLLLPLSSPPRLPSTELTAVSRNNRLTSTDLARPNIDLIPILLAKRKMLLGIHLNIPTAVETTLRFSSAFTTTLAHPDRFSMQNRHHVSHSRPPSRISADSLSGITIMRLSSA
ncbi:hypothetical protein CDV31_009495 [Fusarium ambrosium]|uniref:Uncharacterized protein n=1 Tax=Fusarium ambrosium TaxID=131363 RepID=A0A428TUH7_9HYPO|nr:hypothetical protein CDV31_009495 [Fusarium ambrosium]